MTSIAWSIVLVGILFLPEEGDNEIKVCCSSGVALGFVISMTMLLISTIHDLLK